MNNQLLNIAKTLNLKTYITEKEKAITKIINFFDDPNLPDITLYKEADSGSTYFKFDYIHQHGDKQFGQLRIGDHLEKKNLGYRWQLRYDITESYSNVKHMKSHTQYYYPFSELSKMLSDMKQFYLYGRSNG